MCETVPEVSTVSTISLSQMVTEMQQLKGKVGELQQEIVDMKVEVDQLQQERAETKRK